MRGEGVACVRCAGWVPQGLDAPGGGGLLDRRHNGRVECLPGGRRGGGTGGVCPTVGGPGEICHVLVMIACVNVVIFAGPFDGLVETDVAI